MICEEIRKELFLLQDKRYQQFQARLLPTLPADTVIGVRTPQLRRYAKDLANRKDLAEFLEDLPHRQLGNLRPAFSCGFREAQGGASARNPALARVLANLYGPFRDRYAHALLSG